MDTTNDDPRMGDIITQGDDGDIVLVGFPYDEGVKRNGGRPGAKNGPNTLRRLMQRVGTVINPSYGVDISTIRVSDYGNITEFLTLEEAHEELERVVTEIIKKGGIPFVVGGGNDQSYPNACGLLSTKDKGSVGVVNIDAHFDVRPLKNGKVHSGSPFRLLLEDDRFDGKNFYEFAAQGSQCSQQHYSYICSQGGKVSWFRNVVSDAPGEFTKIMNAMPENIFVSFDIDSIRGSDAPGVSCPATIGLSALDAVTICYLSGKNPGVALFDLSEFNPDIEDYRTARLVSNMFYHFALGVA
eukprot:CAMPEP_0174274636 /NCGR_PEP_ID=MMETSP0439-20130205/58699_1 /TAXON_ID=0 /ORGANISM="Stereomyxa ramosa, Strain Chinc5" /LENGTH=297 /DNA_ID=CAMNT_0015366531 /DNA_START=143 /DNA_END=1033 /DNA_ORIENTATION=+